MSDTNEIKEEDKTEEIQNQEPEAKIDVKEEDVVEKNWRAVREKQKERERLEKEQQRKIEERDQMIAALQEALKSNQPQQSQAPQSTPQTNSSGYDIDDKDWITGKQLKEFLEKDKKKKEEENRKQEQERMQQESLKQMAARYPDYQEVLSKENLAYLEYHEPEIAAGIQNISDPYLSLANAYKSVKKFVPPMTQADKEKIERNQQMPKSPSQTGVGVNPHGEGYSGGRLSKDRKAELYAEARRYAR